MCHRRSLVLRQQRVLGVTGHYLQEDNLKRKTYAIACIRIKGSVTNDVLAKEIHAVLMVYNIQNKCVGVVTDSGANFVKTFKVYG